ncbi:MAG TPA: flavodoxin [Desulfobacteraceae bacterium]|nr:flavodoxin [Desulfobacteraceae bacterium]
MSNALIIYGSTTGNTAYTAETIAAYLTANGGYEVSLKSVADIDVSELNDAWDLYLLGCSTWGEEEIELQEDFESFYEGLTGDLNLSGKKFAVFGCGDSSYEYFCGAVDVIEERVQKLGATLVADSLRIDGEPEEEEINEWTRDVIHGA